MLTDKVIEKQLKIDIDWEPEEATDAEWELIEKIRSKLLDQMVYSDDEYVVDDSDDTWDEDNY